MKKIKNGKDGKNERTSDEPCEDGESQWRNSERKFGSVKVEKMVSVHSRAARLKESFVGHHDRTGAVLCITQSGFVRGKSWTAQPLKVT